jgi:hypothetical protein
VIKITYLIMLVKKKGGHVWPNAAERGKKCVLCSVTLFCCQAVLQSGQVSGWGCLCRCLSKLCKLAFVLEGWDRLDGYYPYMEETRNACRTVVGKPEKKRPLVEL